MSKEAYFGRASGLDRSHRAVPDHSYSKTFERSMAEKETGSLPQVALYEHLHFEGGSALTTFDWKYLGDWWTNKVASIARDNTPSVEILHQHDPLVVLVHLRVHNGFSVGRYRQTLRLAVEGRDCISSAGGKVEKLQSWFG